MSSPIASVVQIGKYYAPVVGGIENNVRQLALACVEDFNSHVICMRRGRGPRESFSDAGAKVTILSSYGAVWRQEIVESPASILHTIKPDVIHFHTPNPLLAFPIISYLNSRPEARLVVSHHADLQRPEPLRWFANTATRILLHRAVKVVSYTRVFAEHSRELAPHLGKLEILPHGVAEPEVGSPAHNRRATHPGGMLRLGFLGRVERWKGVDLLLDILRSRLDLSLVVAGEGSYRSTFERRVDAARLGGRVCFLGQVDQARKELFFQAIDVLVLPSLNAGESYGQTLVEAQLRGVPVIATDLPTGIREICDFGRAGLLFPKGNKEILLARIDELSNPKTYDGLVKAGRQRAHQLFSERAVRSRISDFYHRVLA